MKMPSMAKQLFSCQRNLELTAGGRAFDETLSYNAVNSGLLNAVNFTGAVTAGGKRNDTGFTPKVTLSYKPNPDLNIYGLAAKGYRTGGLNFSVNTTLGIPATYAPDSLWNYEVGLKASALEHRLNFDIAAYHIDWSNVQVGLNNTFEFVNNAGSAAVDGLEFNGSYALSSNLKLGTRSFRSLINA